ncbi:RrF2 family transcriptional regulator [Corynebacterium epidermidicanis]|uniref:Transcriptional regulator, BadM/Rrf2 family n=1 Tax=Corynebacterium epidermidicanis TaxID=1050174 RepID=A0A0G3GYN7_9CORY|nr:Rrf2 family transcriptional regulator [Corynebacterium epidermidicanis]AKK03982.1 transcriptional regulator, BadM/Rrf2 family [Corynebacterium epidermidicanis]
MHLTRFTDLGLRLVLRLGEINHGNVDKPAVRTTVAMLAEDINASYAHVARVVATLADMGVLRSERGRAGGVYLQDEALQRTIGGLLRKLEGGGEMVNCMQPVCPYASRDCLLRHRLAAAKEAFFVSLDDLTIAELIDATVANSPHVGLGMPKVS